MFKMCRRRLRDRSPGSGRALCGVGWGQGVTCTAALIVPQPSPAHAHLLTTGLGPYYDGLAHPFVSPEDIVAVLALALLAGLCERPASRLIVLVVPVTSLAGGLLGLKVPSLPLFPWLAVFTFLGLGVLIAVNVRLGPAAAASLAAILGLAHGFATGNTLAASQSPVTVLAGTATAQFLVVAIVAAAVVSLRTPWARVGVRAMGSWIAAGGLLLLGWTLRGIA